MIEKHLKEAAHEANEVMRKTRGNVRIDLNVQTQGVAVSVTLLGEMSVTMIVPWVELEMSRINPLLLAVMSLAGVMI